MLIDKSNDKTRALFALSTAAMSLGLAPKHAFAAMEEGTTVSVQLSNYGEDKLPIRYLLPGGGAAERYDITTGQFRIRSAIGEDTEIVFSAAAETMSGASPWYVRPGLEDNTVDEMPEEVAEGEEGETTADSDVDVIQVMSGATIDEERTEGNLTLRKYWGHSNFGLHFGYSNESDYRSNSFGISSAISLNDQATTIELALSASQDYIEPTDSSSVRDRVVKEDKNAKNGSAGITQIINKNLLVSSTISFSRYKGFLSDAYKRAWIIEPGAGEPNDGPDSRPGSKSQFAWTVAGRYFLEPLNAAIHADYRYYTNDWGIVSNTVEFGWHQNFLENVLLLAPQIRFYAQSEAEFYALFYETPRVDGFYSSDYRLSEYTSVSAALQASLRFDKYNIHANFERYVSTGDNPGLVDFNFVSVGFDLKF